MKRLQIIVAFALVYFVWGSTHFAVGMVVETFPPLAGAATRFLLAGTILFIIARAASGERPTRRQWRTAWILGALLPGAGNGLLFVAQQEVSPTIVAILVATEPIWIALLAARWLGEPLRPISWAGIGLASVGVFLLANPLGGAGLPAVDLRGCLLVLAATFAWAAGSVYGRRVPTPRSAPLGAGMMMLTGGVLLLGASLLSGEWVPLQVVELTPRSLGALAYLAVFGSVLTYSAYVFLSQNVSAGRLSTYGYVNPLVGMALGGLIAGEQIDARMLWAAAVILGGALLLAMPGLRRPQPRAA